MTLQLPQQQRYNFIKSCYPSDAAATAATKPDLMPTNVDSSGFTHSICSISNVRFVALRFI
jgi:hypothetical protein